MLSVILEGESLFNDASSLTLFEVGHDSYHDSCRLGLQLLATAVANWAISSCPAGLVEVALQTACAVRCLSTAGQGIHLLPWQAQHSPAAMAHAFSWPCQAQRMHAYFSRALLYSPLCLSYHPYNDGLDLHRGG